VALDGVDLSLVLIITASPPSEVVSTARTSSEVTVESPRRGAPWMYLPIQSEMAWYMKVSGYRTWASCWSAESIEISKGENYMLCGTILSLLQDKLDSLVNLRSTNLT